jgi:MYXO-CTERM domain-containing protein
MTPLRPLLLAGIAAPFAVAACSIDSPVDRTGSNSQSAAQNAPAAAQIQHSGPADLSRAVEQQGPMVSISGVEESRPLRDYKEALRFDQEEEESEGEAHPVRRIPRNTANGMRPVTPDPVVQKDVPIVNMPAALNSFAGQGKSVTPTTVTGTPPDTNGAVGPNHYVQVVNGGIAIWDKTGTIKQTAKLTNGLWSGYTGTNAGNGCAANNDGDPVVVYDQLADRWFVTQFSLPNLDSAPNYQCVAVSKTPDPTGAYYLYDFKYDGLNDYGKFGIWPDGYYATYNIFNGNGFTGGDLCVFDRVSMLAGKPATQQCFQQTADYGGMLPVSLDGKIPPPRGTPGFFIGLDKDPNGLAIWKLKVDWTTPANSKMTGPIVLPVAAYTPACDGAQSCIPVTGGSRLDGLDDRLMFRLSYRNFGTHEALFLNHSVTGAGGIGVRWYELRAPSTTPTVFQQGTYAPADGKSRWIGSLAQDQAQDIALGFSASSSATNPAIGWTGRLPADPAGTMGQGETIILSGTSHESGATRWGDYSNMTVDPNDDCTFWYTTEFYKTTGTATWDTQIASVKFPTCAANDFTAALDPPNQNLEQKKSVTFKVNTTKAAGTPEQIVLNIQDLPAGVTAAFAPATVNAGDSSTLTLTATDTTPIAPATAFLVIGKAPSAVHAAGAQVTIVTCQPSKTCTNGNTCDQGPDGCGGTISCGTCAAPQTCGGRGTPGKCGCNTPTTCQAEGAQCGPLDDKCGGTLDCGTCPGGGQCVANKCVGGTGGTSGANGDAGTGNGDNGDNTTTTTGCGCRTVPTGGESAGGLALLGAALVLVRRRRRS